ncbi:endonuclease domain-containing protein [Humibacter ginsenosidimutans]|uniref:DUF559 domain-containing protein n=1 Tax=Humibacter ginsenosidimutans TaxID=2599293 RepID=A0A5B8M417_9MICO|nr:DUF559 domain-containing protein [Humibacter ginsenosidimutans]QDZ15036.1 DUF559 domain-containing protein [Humibacter ginsenosidimutans]
MQSDLEAGDLGVVSIADLFCSGATRREIAMALETGALARIRRGWYARSDADEDAIEAVYLGGALTSVSAAPHHRMWTMGDGRLHVAVPANASRLRRTHDDEGVLVDRHGTPICLHWSPVAGAFGQAIVIAGRVLMDAGICQPAENVIAMADSAIYRNVLRREEVDSCLPSLAARLDGTSQSGTESLVRDRLRRLGVRVRSQVRIGGVGIVDLLVGDRLVIECDSSGFHDGYASKRDYDRDLALVAMGYIVIRLRYDHVLYHWERAEAAILTVIHERRHLRRGAGRRVVLD